ncbi:hypothetical protein C0995_006987 [Termitomyces sp. Mi166|nr:hypothetical protein C0995_006987 [Termitomyces sp. Mi166\
MAPKISLLKISADASLLEHEREHAAQEFIVAADAVFFKAQGLAMLAPLHKTVFGLLEELLDDWRLLRHKAEHVMRGLMTEQKAQKQQECLDAKQEYQQALQEAQSHVHTLAEGLQTWFQKHSVNYYYKEIMQILHVQKKSKKSGSWNAFVSMEMQQMNAELPPDVPKKKVHNFIKDIAAKWNSFTDEQKRLHTEEKLITLHKTHEMHDLASHNVPISMFHDTRSTLDNIDKEIKQLHAWTGIEVLMLAVHASKEHYSSPHILTMSDCVETFKFVELTLKENLFNISMRMEAYILSGVQAVVCNYVEENIHLRSEISSLILYKLKEITNAKISRMYYQNFDLHITSKYGVVIKNWPLKTLCTPSEISSCIELKLLLEAWQTNTARFYKMTHDEFEVWEMQRVEALTRNIDGDGDVTSGSAGDLSTSTLDMSAQLVTPDTTSSVGSNAALPPTPLTTNIVNTVSGGNGSVVFVTKKTHKVRKDKGIKRKKPTTPEIIS